MFGQLTTTLLEVSNLVASQQFYVEKLGLKLVAQGEGWVCVSGGGGAQIVMWQGSKPSVSMGFTTETLDAALQAATERGLKPSELMQHPGGQHFDLVDPDGHPIMIAND